MCASWGDKDGKGRLCIIVVFPTAVAPRAGGLDVYYGMADARIGAVHLRLTSPSGAKEVAAWGWEGAASARATVAQAIDRATLAR